MTNKRTPLRYLGSVGQPPKSGMDLWARLLLDLAADEGLTPPDTALTAFADTLEPKATMGG